MDRIGIIGGGFSGLLSAMLLEEALGGQVEIVVLEGSNRRGGRMRTTRVPGPPASYEAGVAEFYDIAGNPQLRQLVRYLNLATRPLVGRPYFSIGNQVIRDDAGLERLLGRRGIDRLRRFWADGTAGRSPADYARAGQPRDNEHPWLHRTFEHVLSEIDDPLSEWFTAVQCHSDLATEPARTSGLFGMDNLLIDHPGYCSMYTLVDGNEGLIQALSDRVRSPVLRDAPVTRVDAHPDRGFRLTCRTVDEPRHSVDLDALIVTLPPSRLRAIRWSDAALCSAVQAHVLHHDHGTAYLRVTLFCRRRFWRDQFPEDYFVSDAFGGVTVYDQSPDRDGDGVGVQSWLIAGANALELADRSDEGVVAAVLSAMPSALRVSDDVLIEGRVDRWLGAAGVSGLPGGVPLLSLEKRHIPDPRWPRLLFVGDYLYDSTLCGAVDAVLYGVGRIAEGVGGSSKLTRGGIGQLFASPSGSVADEVRAPSCAFFLDEQVASVL